MAVQDCPTSALCVSYIDVGKGDCILLQADGTAGLIDAGYEDTSGKVLAHMRARGIDHLAFLIITHYDRDHVEGVGPLGKSLPIEAIYLPGYEGSDKNYQMLMRALKDLGASPQQLSQPLSLRLGSAELKVSPSRVRYVPASGKREGNDNDLSLVATLINGDDTYLFTGDLEEEGIEAYLEERQGHFDVLKMPHHGQRSSSTDELLEVVRPHIAVITDSDDEPADKKTLKLLNEVGATTYRTSSSGTIVITSDGTGNYSVSTDK